MAGVFAFVIDIILAVSLAEYFGAKAIAQSFVISKTLKTILPWQKKTGSIRFTAGKNLDKVISHERNRTKTCRDKKHLWSSVQYRLSVTQIADWLISTEEFYERTIKSIENALSAGMEVSVKAVINSGN